MWNYQDERLWSCRSEMKILLIEDDETISFGICSALGRKGYEVAGCSGMEEGKRIFSEEISLILLDLNLPDGSGYDFCEWVKAKSDIPVIFLTVRDDVEGITHGLDMGADDYITKPFHIAVLESRIQAVLRRTSGRNVPKDLSEGSERGSDPVREKGSEELDFQILVCGAIRLDKKKRRVLAEEEIITLSDLEYRLLLMLMENKGCILTRGRILEKLWDARGNFVNDNTLTVAMKRLREKLHHTPCITTVRGVGYRMEEKG